ncbi:MAG: tRNA (adenine-N1)-methyltransferase [Proteobacteria bacterium]|nr:tRNA (adenine-N1)-methyltransferase [Pseudomonadota bacterium]
MDTIKEGSYLLISSKKSDTYLVKVTENGDFSTHEGKILFKDLIGKPYGCKVKTHLGAEYIILKPTITDFLKFIKRKTQVLYPKDLGFIILKLNLHSGLRMIECGSGSGSATTAFAFALYPEGKLYSYEARPEFINLAKENVKRTGLEQIVEFKNRDIEEGFDEKEVDALFLDVKYPEKFIYHAYNALKPSGNMCVFVPTANQVSDVLKELENYPFALTEVLEIMLRTYKTVPERLRPDDTMIAHTGYLIFTRKIEEQKNGE